MTQHKKQKGAVLIICMIFLSIFAALAVSMVEMSDTNAQIANDYRHANQALSNAQSGLEVIRHYLSEIDISGTVTPENRLTAVQTALQNEFTDESITNVAFTSADSNSATINITGIQSTSNVTVTINKVDDDTLRVNITGTSDQFSRTISVEFDFATTGNDIFDFGVATKGPLVMTGQTGINDSNLVIESNVYIEGDVDSGDAFSMTNDTVVSDDVVIANPYATYNIGSQASIGGETGEAAEDHITVGSGYVPFPEPNPEYFRSFATGEVIDANYNWDHDAVLNNVTIAANTNPTFASTVTINGILFIEMPNRVHFSGQSTINGIIIANGNTSNESTDNNIHFSGQVVCNDMSGLEGAEFDQIKQETGTFILAPGFSLEFSGQENNMAGAIAGNGIAFTGEAGGTINGSLLNYSQTPISLSGETSLTLTPSGSESNPSGFVPMQVLEFQPTSYAETAM